MWMEVPYTVLKQRHKLVKFESKIKWQHKKAKAERKSSRNCKNFHVLPENLAKGLGSRREHCWGYVSIYENTPGNLVVQRRVQLKCNSHIAKVRVEATCHANTSSPEVYWRNQLNQWALLELCHRKPDPGKGAKPDCIIKLIGYRGEWDVPPPAKNLLISNHSSVSHHLVPLTTIWKALLRGSAHPCKL